MSHPAASVSNTIQTTPIVTYDGKVYNIVSEGTAEILNLRTPDKDKSTKDGAPKSQSVFYNPIQQYNRDLSVLAIRAFGDDLIAVRKARQQRRVEQLAKTQQRGKKRKGASSENQGDELQGGAKKAKEGVEEDEENGGVLIASHEEPTTAINGDAKRTRPTLDVPFAGQDARPSETSAKDSNAIEEHKVSADSGVDVRGEQEAKDPTGAAPNGPKHSKQSIPIIQPAFRILDALSATGLRALRYAKEIPVVTSITANDLSTAATASIQLNVDHNKLTDKVVPNTSDAIEHMHYAASHRQRPTDVYHVIDLDPYGTAAPLLDAAVQAIADGGLLCVTCTDAGVFASVGYLEKTYSQYGGLPLKGPHAHEGGLRLILHAIATSAARYGMAIEPLLSLSIDFYARVFVRIHRSPAEVKFLASKTMLVYSCDSGCGAWSTQFLARPNKKQAKNGNTVYTFTQAVAPSKGTHCDHCGFKTHLGGPMWGGPLHNPNFIQRILDMLPTLDRTVYGTIPRIEGMLSVALNESINDTPSSSPSAPALERPVPPIDPAARAQTPFFFLPSSLSRVLHCVCPSDAAVRGALLHLGYRATRSHTKAGSICTDAPWSVIWEIMREWVRQRSPVKDDGLKERTAGRGIMRNDRSQIRLVEERDRIREIVDDQELKNMRELKRNLEAALYRISKLGETREIIQAEPTVAVGATFLNGSKPKDKKADESDNEKQTIIGDAKTQESSTQTPPVDSHPSRLVIVFDEKLGKEPEGKRMVRYQVNPRADWGPMNRAKADD